MLVSTAQIKFSDLHFKVLPRRNVKTSFARILLLLFSLGRKNVALHFQTLSQLLPTLQSNLQRSADFLLSTYTTRKMLQHTFSRFKPPPPPTKRKKRKIRSVQRSKNTFQ